MILITGAAGFIGSCLCAYLNREGYGDLILSDYISTKAKQLNLKNKGHTHLLDRRILFHWLKGKEKEIECVLHLGARTNTFEKDYSVFEELNVNYSKKVWKYCTEHQIPLIYASSAATYGNGDLGFKDDESLIPRLKQMNPYALSKNEFDKWALQQTEKPFFWAGLKFFNVYGPNEYHKGPMASVVWHAYQQLLESESIRLFKSYRPDCADGEQRRDFIYVFDVLKIIHFMMTTRKTSGIFNVGTGAARSFNDLAGAVFAALDRAPNLEYIDMPMEIRANYQYYTEADVSKLRAAGYDAPFTSLEDGVRDYVTNYLVPEQYF